MVVPAEFAHEMRTVRSNGEYGVETVPIAELQQEKSTESVASVSRCSDTLATSMTNLCSTCHSYITKRSGVRR